MDRKPIFIDSHHNLCGTNCDYRCCQSSIQPIAQPAHYIQTHYICESPHVSRRCDNSSLNRSCSNLTGNKVYYQTYK